MMYARRECGELPVLVEQYPDWLDYMGAFSGLVGAFLAASAIWYASRQSVNAKRDLARERRTEFELGLLANIRHQMSITKFQHLAGYVGALIVDATDETDLPVLRAIIGIKSGPLGILRKEKIKQSTSVIHQQEEERMRVATEEVDAAIQRRLER
ncbi:hypothetical protein [Promicromonospora sukumoe]|uniref:hypothetical protein n=1 Tax=Promicromonospora sukumoe TaxID=88382 RepID=UPI0036664758